MIYKKHRIEFWLILMSKLNLKSNESLELTNVYESINNLSKRNKNIS